MPLILILLGILLTTSGAYEVLIGLKYLRSGHGRKTSLFLGMTLLPCGVALMFGMPLEGVGCGILMLLPIELLTVSRLIDNPKNNQEL
jgi:uncharacterized membrane protein HdeD (DUF308 family)